MLSLHRGKHRVYVVGISAYSRKVAVNIPANVEGVLAGNPTAASGERERLPLPQKRSHAMVAVAPIPTLGGYLKGAGCLPVGKSH